MLRFNLAKSTWPEGKLDNSYFDGKIWTYLKQRVSVRYPNDQCLLFKRSTFKVIQKVIPERIENPFVNSESENKDRSNLNSSICIRKIYRRWIVNQIARSAAMESLDSPWVITHLTHFFHFGPTVLGKLT